MAQMTASNPLSDLMFDWLTVLQNKAEGLAAYEQYIEDAEEVASQECVELFRKLHERDAQMVQEIKDHVFDMIQHQKV